MPATIAGRLVGIACVASLTLASAGCTFGSSSTETSTPTPTPTPTPSSSSPAATPAQDAKSYTSTEAGFEVSYPKTWESKEGVLGTVVSFRSPQEGSKDAFRDNVTILTQSVPPGSTLEQYTSASLDQLKRTVDRYDLVSQGEGSLGSNEGYTLVYQTEYKGLPLQLEATYVLKDGTVYLVTYTATKEDFDRYESDADLVVDSFTPLEP